MAIVREIKRRIKSVKNIKQITKALEMVAASKIRQAQDQALRSRPYSEKMTEVLRNLAAKTDPHFHPLLQKGRGEKELILFIGPKRRLCGGLLNNLENKLLSWLTQKTIDFILIGKRGGELLLKLKQNVIAEFSDLSDQPMFAETLPISQMVINGFVEGKYHQVAAIYPHFINTLTQKPVLKQILPIKEEIQKEEKWQYVLYEPSSEAILSRLLPFYVELLVYHLILESIASEHSARMIAMKNATDNAREMLAELTLIYNQARQTNITREVAEIAAARAALKS